MSADQATHFFPHRDCPIRVTDHRLVAKAGSRLIAPRFRLREGKANDVGANAWVILDRSIHEFPAFLKFDRACCVGSTLKGVRRAGRGRPVTVRA